MSADDTNDITTIARDLRDKLPVLSPHAESILRACESPNIDAATLAAMLAESPTIAARVLGLANSSFYSRGKSVYALPKAIQTLGLVTVRGIAIGLVVGSQFSPARCPAFEAVHFWKSAVLSAQLAQQLAVKVPPELELEREAAYMTGLLHNIGLLALASLLPEIMSALLSVRNAASPPLCEQLRTQIGFDHHMAATWLADAWRLPAPMRHALGHHGDRDYHADNWPLVHLTGLSARCAHAIVVDNAEAGQVVRSETETITSLGLDEAIVEHAVAMAATAFDTLQATAETLSGHTQ